MRHYNVWQLALSIAQIGELECLHNSIALSEQGPRLIEKPWIEMKVSPIVAYCRKQCEQIELQAALERIDGPLRVHLRTGITDQLLATELRVLRESIDGELKYRRFAFVPTEKARILDAVGHEWGDIWITIPSSKTDTDEAVYCYALDRNTACVFHSMRVAEHGLRALAKKLRVALTYKGKHQPIEFADWEKMITAIRNKVNTARETFSGKKRAETIQRYSDLADHCSYMKDIWRNEVSHTRKPYVDREALIVLQRVRGFMGALVQQL